MSSLYGEYVKEREGKQILESEKGFMTYKIQGQECYIADVYIRPEYRMSGVASEFANKIQKIAKNQGCKFLTGSVTPSLKGATESIIAQLKFGFKLHSSHEDFIILKKEI